MKAWSCSDDMAECGYIVFAPTRGKARSIAMGADGFDWSEWCDVRVRRMPGLDDETTTEGVLDWQKGARIYYEAGWFPVDGAGSCDSCGLYQYDEFPESTVTETDEGEYCRACLDTDGE